MVTWETCDLIVNMFESGYMCITLTMPLSAGMGINGCWQTVRET